MTKTIDPAVLAALDKEAVNLAHLPQTRTWRDVHLILLNRGHKDPEAKRAAKRAWNNRNGK